MSEPSTFEERFVSFEFTTAEIFSELEVGKAALKPNPTFEVFSTIMLEPFEKVLFLKLRLLPLLALTNPTETFEFFSLISGEIKENGYISSKDF